MGTLNSLASTTFDVDFYASADVDVSGFGEGESYLGTTSVTTDGSGDASFNFIVPGTVTMPWITATATDPVGNTSEFSEAMFLDVSDFGDCADTYRTTLGAGANGGARHAATGVLLGSRAMARTMRIRL